MTTTRTLPQTIARVLGRNAVIVLVFGSIAFAAAATPQPKVSIARPEAQGTPTALIQAHDCWTGQAPEDVTWPGSVVVTKGYTARWTKNPTIVRQALEQALDGADHGLTVHAFCR